MRGAGRAARAPLYQELVGPSPLLPVAAARRHRLAAAVRRASHDAAPARQLSAAARCLLPDLSTPLADPSSGVPCCLQACQCAHGTRRPWRPTPAGAQLRGGRPCSTLRSARAATSPSSHLARTYSHPVTCPWLAAALGPGQQVVV